MFFKEKRQAEKEARAALRDKILHDVNAQLDEAKAIADPGERILRLKNIEEEVDGGIKRVSEDANGDVFGRGFRDGSGVFGGAVVLSIWAAISLSSPWILLMMIPGMIAAFKVGGRTSDKLEHALYEENKGFYAELNTRRTEVTALTKNVIDNDWSAIAKSKKAQEVFNTVPALREKYASAFCKGVASGDISTPDHTPPAVISDQAAQDATVVQQPIDVARPLRFKKSPGA